MSDPKVPLHQMNPLERFSDRAADYAKFRPSYPAEALASILEGLGDPRRLTAADVGAGTGISARLLADRGVTVFAVEPNAAMRDAAAAHGGVTFVASNAEASGLPGGSVDLVTCFQSFHWFRHAECLREFQRILRPRGRVALVWNVRDERDAFTAGYSRLVREASENHPAENRANQTPAQLAASGLFDGIRELHCANSQVLSLEALIGRAASSSYIPRSGPRYDALLAGLTGLYRQFADDSGTVCEIYDTEITLAEVK